MKYILILSAISLIALTKCHVTQRMKNVEVTTQFPDENNTRNDSLKEIYLKKNNFTKSNLNRVYLDDVLFMLNNQNWTAEEEPCINQILHLIRGLQNFTLWSVWEWDSQASQPQGLLFGNRYQLGNFDECMNAPWSTYQQLQTKYCLAEIVLERTDMVVRKRIHNRFYPYQSALDFIEYHPPNTRGLNSLTWGACAPAVCHPHTIERLLGVMLARSHLGAAGMRANITISEPCQMYGNHREFDALFYTFFGIIGWLMVLALVCTYLNNRSKQLNPNKFYANLIKAFCLKENTKDLLKMRKEGLEVFYGIRFISICFIVLDHQIGISNAGPISDTFTSAQEIESPLGLLILHDDLFVDTFFLLSGFLTVTYIAKLQRFPNPFLVIFKRYMRLVVALAVVIFYVCAVYPYTGSGPLWNRAIAGNTEQCRKNWWINLLMLQNYIDSENICIIISWYIPCDFHFFVLTVMLYWLYKRLPRLGLICAVIVTVTSVILPGVITYLYELPAVQLFTFEFVSNPRASKDFHLTYVKSHTRYAAYLVGFFSGYFFITYYKTDEPKKISKKWSIIGTCSALVMMLVVMVSGSAFQWRTYHPLEGALYASLNRPAWACAVALLVFCCSFGHVPLVKGFLSWYVWVPLSRLTYGLYLTHTIIIERNIFVTRNPQHNDYFEILNSTAGVVFWGCIAALLIWLFVEAPVNNILALCLRSKVQKFLKDDENKSNLQPNISASTTSGTTHLQNNMPSTIYLSSKI